MNLDLPILCSINVNSPKKRSYSISPSRNMYSTTGENDSDTFDTRLGPTAPQSPRILGPRPISRISARRHKPVSRLMMPPPIPKPAKIDTLEVNGQDYTLHELLGSGGSSKVYKVSDSKDNVFALKLVNTKDQPAEMVRMFGSEIDLLRSFRHNDRVVQLYNHETLPHSIMMVMERGESDLNQVIRKDQLDNDSIRFFTIEILKCVEAIHSRNIIHSDLKPANFIIVKGMIKLIDFGIAAPIPDFTCNVYKNEQIGTISYMAPEAFHEHTGVFGFKVGKQSDMWSCGCIIYELIYGRPPFHKYGRSQMQAIINPNTRVDYPEMGKNGTRVPKHMMQLIKSLLQTDTTMRFTCLQALEHLTTGNVLIDKAFALDLIRYTSKLGEQYGRMPSEPRLNKITDEVWAQLQKLTLGAAVGTSTKPREPVNPPKMPKMPTKPSMIQSAGPVP